MRTRNSLGELPTSPSEEQTSAKKRGHAEDEPQVEKDLTPRKRRKPTRFRESPQDTRKKPATAPKAVVEPKAKEEDGRPPKRNASDLIGDAQEEPAQTPTKRKPGRPKGSKNLPKPPLNGIHTTPSKSQSGRKWATPIKTNGPNGIDTPRRRNLADRSARKKSVSTMIERVVSGMMSDDEAGDDVLAREIYQSSEDEDDEDGGQQIPTVEVEAPAEDLETGEQSEVAPTPTRRRPGRPKGSGKNGPARKRSPTPPRDLPPYERYFFQNKPGSLKTSGNRLNMELLTHEEYFNLVRDYKDPHVSDVTFLQNMHADSFRQWAFELSQGFSICLYGYGSKRALLQRFATELYHRGHKRIVVVNGYVRTSGGIKEALSTMARAVDPSFRLPATLPVTMAQGLTALLADHPETVLTIIVNSIDAPGMRKGGSSNTTQAILAQLASHKQIRLVCSADTPDFSLLWDAGQRSQFNFAMHDCTTFAPFGAAELDVVDEVHELLGRKDRRVGGKDGVIFVLRSLPENAKNLFRLLVTEALVAMEEGSGMGMGDFLGADGPGVEYRMMYNKAVEEFICSSEMAFRTLLKEFHDHQIITSRKDTLGTELLCLPFRKEEIEGILEDLMG
ncbi:origin recognition complex subunit [Pyricularia oryzae 70-15]|uniref:Origin recognition complex subunit 2 n=3 Tax=Pyricularia oryzae TaxID=318829 RepID=G4N1T7_PYRO7|nr:origin recognition complex subunit [Pyricularia oryzae 70-15]EHA52452.1 origin recognition complex subunit [Pyricularia oryzae 70-15]ELQ39224.1 origin recognition complex subunit 2 [Pyricularia oryzae Y34]KAI7916480.1 origin recognition complex subunit [Pyricularia oryzae]KAI7917551.1 origin recognition complex subunit [Pyricularia oryzae]